MKILNLTQHKATKDQINAGVVDLIGDELEYLKKLLTFDEIPSKFVLDCRAEEIAMITICNGLGNDLDDPTFSHAMIGGAPFFMPALESALLDVGVTPLYAFSKRVSVEKDGVKTSVFKHLGFVGF